MDITTIHESNLKKIDNMLKDEDEKYLQFSTQWVEQEAVIFLQQELNKYKGIFDSSGIKVGDKNISFDGQISVMNNANIDGNDWAGYIDVQVKGTCVNEFKKGNSKFPLEVKHLKNYVKHPAGVLFFVVQIKEDTLEKKLFYRYLLPVDLQEIFMEIKKDQKSKTIDIYPIDLSKKTSLKRVCLEFLKARDRQIGKRIIILDKDTKPTKLLIQDFRESKTEYLQDKVYMYIQLNDNKEFLPAIMPDNGKIGAINIIEKPIILNGIKFYDSFKQIVEKNNKLYQFGKNVTYDTEINKFKFQIKGTFDEIITDIKFALMIIEITENNSKELTKDLEKKLAIIEEFKKNLNKINININEEFPCFSDIDYWNMDYFNRLTNQDIEIVTKRTTGLCNIRLCNKNIIIFLEKDEIKSKFTIYNFFDNLSKKFIFTVKDEELYNKICPYTALLDRINFEDIWNFNKESVYLSIKDCENNDVNKEGMNLLALSFINSYDKTKNNDFYELAKEIINMLIGWDSQEKIYIINQMQLTKRKRNLTEKEKSKLYNIKNDEKDNIEILYAISILLENKSDIEYYYNQLNDKSRQELSKLPIEKLKIDL